jgi:hypothetical protein
MEKANEITLETLAEMSNEGFKSTASKEDLAALRAEMHQKFEGVLKG